MCYPQPESQRKEFSEKLESLLRRAYHLQEEFGSTFPADSMLLDLGEQGPGAGSLGSGTSSHQGPTARMGRPRPHRWEQSWDEAPRVPGQCALPPSPWEQALVLLCPHLPPPTPAAVPGFWLKPSPVATGWAEGWLPWR